MGNLLDEVPKQSERPGTIDTTESVVQKPVAEKGETPVESPKPDKKPKKK